MRNKWNEILVTAALAMGLTASAHAQFMRVDGGAGAQEFSYKIAGDPQNTFFYQIDSEPAVVKNSPYTAKAITTTVQTLADGNKITHTNEVQLARDSDGRTRREQNLANIGPWQTNDKGSIISINDPVAHVRYELRQSGDKVISANKTLSVERTRVLEAKAKAEADSMRVREGHGIGVGVGVGDEPGMDKNIVIVTSDKQDSVLHSKVELDRAQSKDVRTEDLGTQSIEGVSVNGKRTTVTIPAGQIGNDQPINIVTETWYSPELQLTVMSKRNDPRTGETEFKMTNIQRVEPDPTLFQAPPGVEVITPKAREREF
jgi:hypothetical protein